MERIRPHLLVYLFYFAVSLVITWPLAMNLGTHLVGFPYGDSTEMARHIWWYNHALRTGQSVFWQPALGYPDGMGGVLFWAHPQQLFPAWLFAFFMPIPAAANLSILLYMALNGWGMFVLARYLLAGRTVPALLAGLAFMAAPTFQAHLAGGHAGLMVMWPVPLYIYAVLRLIKAASSRRKWFALAVLFFVLSPGGHILQLIYVMLPVTVVLALVALWRGGWRALLRLALVNVAGSAILMIFVLPVAQETFSTAAYTAEGGFVRYSADLLAVVTPSFFNPLYSGLSYPRQVLGVNLEEGSSYIGVIAGGLLLVGLVASRRRWKWWVLLLALLAWILSLGPLLKFLDSPARMMTDGYETYITLPLAAVQNLPLFNLARTPGRFNFTLALAVALLAGAGAAWLWDRLPARHGGRWAVMGLLMVALLVDYQWYWPLPGQPAALPEALQALRSRDDIEAVLNVPWGHLIAAKEGLYLQTAHQKPLVGGHVTRSTPVSPAKLTLLEQTLDPALLQAAGADVVILHRQYLADEQIAHARETLGSPTYEDARFVVFQTPETDEPPGFVARPAAISSLERRADSYVYAPEAGWVDFTGTLTVDEREVDLYLDQQLIHRWTVTGEQSFTVPVPLNGYHVVTLALRQPCPINDNPALFCEAVELDSLQFGDYTPAPSQSVTYDRGVTLVNGLVGEASPGQPLTVRLLWQFDQPRDENDIRFVHVLDAENTLVTQDDRTLGQQPAGAYWSEQVRLTLPDDLPAGEYRVVAGWYTYPDFARFAVLSAVEGAQDNIAQLDTFIQP